MIKYRPIADIAIEIARQRFPQHYQTAGEDECWEWTGSKGRKGYGRLQIKRVWHRAPRLAFAIAKGDPGPNFVCHSCDNPACVNPRHLFLGTSAENTQDRISKGRLLLRRGEDNPKAKLTAELVREIRASSLPNRIFAERLGVSVCTVGQARSGRTWSHIPMIITTDLKAIAMLERDDGQ